MHSLLFKVAPSLLACSLVAWVFLPRIREGAVLLMLLLVVLVALNAAVWAPTLVGSPAKAPISNTVAAAITACSALFICPWLPSRYCDALARAVAVAVAVLFLLAVWL